jgi:5-methylcytosine-specific restriction protein A
MTSRTILYRAVHTKTKWRKVRGHTSLDNALYGRNDGAPGLFAHRARIDYTKHGEPLYAVIWEDGATTGFVVKKDASTCDGTAHTCVPISVILAYEARKGASPTELEVHFLAPADSESLQEPRAIKVQHHLPQGEEGAAYLQEHLVRERDTALAKAKKIDILKATGRLACEACRFDFGVAYGELGAGYCEVHHLKPLANRSGNEMTSLEHLAILCSNCHSIIHRTSPMWSVTDLAAYLSSRTTAGDFQRPLD